MQASFSLIDWAQAIEVQVSSKKCNHCCDTKPTSSFGRNRRFSDGLSPRCSECSRDIKRAWASQNPEAVKRHRRKPGHDARRLDAALYPAVELECRRCKTIQPVKSFSADKTRKTGVSPYCKPCASASKSASQTPERLRDLRAANADKIASQRKVYYQTNKEKIVAAAAQRRRSNPHLRVSISLRVSVYRALKGGKRRPTFSMLGYTSAALIEHLTRHLMPGMTWDNYGTIWHVDHIRPVSSFLMPEQVRECWALSNLRPLWARDNLVKGNRFVGPPLPS